MRAENRRRTTTGGGSKQKALNGRRGSVSDTHPCTSATTPTTRQRAGHREVVDREVADRQKLRGRLECQTPIHLQDLRRGSTDSVTEEDLINSVEDILDHHPSTPTTPTTHRAGDCKVRDGQHVQARIEL